jgi:hypothetical protein
MHKPIPTEVGDVLILRTEQSYTVHAVGQISRSGQQDFEHQSNVQYLIGRAEALAAAEALLTPGHRAFFLNIDTGVWSEISH